MNFYIDKPTLFDIPQMRNLIMPEVQKGIILDRSEDEMAGAIRSYSVVRIAESSALNSSLGASCGDFGNLGRFADSPVQSHAPNSQKTPQPPPQNTRICDLDSANFCHSERSEESKKNPSLRANPQDLRGNPPIEKMQNPQGRLPRSHSLARNDDILDSSLRLRSAQNDKNSARVAESSVVSMDFYKVDCHESANANSRNDIIIAFAALQILSLTLAEVRSLIVAPDFRRKGLATLLINQLLKEARALNLKEVLSLTYQREVFEKLGFKEIAKESLPNQKIWADCIKCKKFPVCDEIALLKTL